MEGFVLCWLVDDGGFLNCRGWLDGVLEVEKYRIGEEEFTKVASKFESEQHEELARNTDARIVQDFVSTVSTLIPQNEAAIG
jgi:hypothetical protein